MAQSDSSGAFSVMEVTEISGHELGHAVDFSFGQSNQSLSPDYTRFVKNDFLSLDYSFVDYSNPNNPGASILRPPCSTNGTAPFDGVIDESTNQPFCTNGIIDSKYAGMRNSKIIQTATPFIMKPDAQTNGWTELYPQAFAFQSYARTLPTAEYLLQTSDGVFNNGYFSCARSWADALLAGNSTPPAGAPTNCTLPIPQWYNPGQ